MITKVLLEPFTEFYSLFICSLVEFHCEINLLGVVFGEQANLASKVKAKWKQGLNRTRMTSYFVEHPS
jgi:hypothetical protein